MSASVENYVDTIVRSIFPEKLFLLATRSLDSVSQSIFCDEPLQSSIADEVFLLAITSKGTGDPLLLSEIVERHSRDNKCRTLIIQADAFNELVFKNHPFALKVVKYATLCYDSGPSFVHPFSFSKPSTLPINTDEVFKAAHHHLSTAESFLNQLNYAPAISNLNIAATETLRAIFLLVTSLQLSTINLDRLYYYTRFVYPQLNALLPRSAPSEEERFQLLAGNAGGCHSPDKDTSHSELSNIHSTIKKLLEQCQHSIP